MKIKITKTDINDSGEAIHDIKVNSKQFDNFNLGLNYHNCPSKKTCGYHKENDCTKEDKQKFVKWFDCYKNQDIFLIISIIISSICMLALTIYLFCFEYKVGDGYHFLFTLIGYIVLLFGFSILDYIVIPNLLELFFYIKLLIGNYIRNIRIKTYEISKEKLPEEYEIATTKHVFINLIIALYKKKKVTKNQVLELKKTKKAMKEKEKENSKNPNFEKIKTAENLVNNVSNMVSNFNYEGSQTKIIECEKNLIEIIKVLKEEPDLYTKIPELFEVGLPDFYKILEYFKKFSESGNKDSYKESSFKKGVEDFLEYVKKQKGKLYFISVEELKYQKCINRISNLEQNGGKK